MIRAEGILCQWLAWLWAGSWQLALLVVLLVPISRMLKQLPSTVRYTLWSLVLIKAFLPPSLAAPWGVGSWGTGLFGEYSATVALFADPVRAFHTAQQLGPEIGVLSTPLPALPKLPVGLLIYAAILGAWALGVAAFSGSVVSSQLRLARSISQSRLLTNGPIHGELLRIARRMGVRPPALYLSADATAPFLCGFLRPRIVLPAGLPGSIKVSDLRAVLQHELIHMQRGDLLMCWLQLVVQAIFWFHPLVWTANEMINEEREYCVDEAMVGRSGLGAFAYGHALLNVIEAMREGRAGAVLGFLGIRPRRPELERRIERILNPRPCSQVLLGASWCFVIGFALVFLPMSVPAPGRQAPGVTKVTIQDVHRDDSLKRVLQPHEVELMRQDKNV